MPYAIRPTAEADWLEIAGPNVELPNWTTSYTHVAGLSELERDMMGVWTFAEVEAPPLPPGLNAVAGVTNDNDAPMRTWSIDHISDAELVAALVAAINTRRDQLIQGDFLFDGDLYQSRPDDQVNIQGMGVQAQLAIAAGALEGDLRWADPDQDFAFILSDNSTRLMDAQTMAALFQTGIAFKSALIHTARAMKDWILDPARTRAELLAYDLTAGWPA